jgi:hypothetical protein
MISAIAATTLTLLVTAFAAPTPQGVAAGSCSALELIIGNLCA